MHARDRGHDQQVRQRAPQQRHIEGTGRVADDLDPQPGLLL